jgi:ABC-type multidrug transport system ATPase subunit
MNALAGFWPASDGSVLVNGTDLYRRFDAFRTDLGYVPQDDIIHRELTAEKALDYVARLRMPADTTAAERKAAVSDELETLGLVERRDVRVGSLSGGQRKRVSIGVERLTRPGLFFLDEATSGLDPVGRRLVRDIISDLRDDGTTVFLNSHLLSEVEITCDRVAFIKNGEVLQVSKLKNLVAGEMSVTIRARGLMPDIVVGLSQWGKNVRADDEHLSLTVASEADLPAINRYLVEQGVEVYALRPEQVSLEDLFIEIVGTDGGL